MFKVILAFFAVMSTVLLLLFAQPQNETQTTAPPVPMAEIRTDKSRYNPGEAVALTVLLPDALNGTDDLTLRTRVRHLTDVVLEQEQPVSGAESDFTFYLPNTDFTGYSVEAVIVDREGNPAAGNTTAVDVSSDWNRYPRFGYLTKWNAVDNEVKATLARLNTYHITGLFYYDVLDQHDKPLAGTVETPDATWATLNNKTASFATVKNYIDTGHAYGMNSYLYNLIFGAYDNYESRGISPEWGLYKDPQATQQDNHDLSSIGWETKYIWLFDPANPAWQNHYLNFSKNVLDAFGYDGLQVDSLGNRGNLYTYNGEKVELADRYQPLLNRLANELHTKVIFNAVSGYGMQQQFAGNTYDIIYEEIWDEHKTYASIKKVVDEFYVKTGGNKGAVLAAYMNHNAPGNAFNPVAVNLTNAVIMASGAAHLELGDTGMLSSEYYPGTSRTIPPELAESTRRYYDFSTAYEELLRGTGLKDTKARAVINGKFARTDGKIGRVWTFSKLKTWDDGKQAEVYHLLNFDGISSEQWGDKQASQTAPKTLMNTKVKLYTHIPVRQVSLATPDTATPADGLLQPVAFKTGWDLLGKYVTFTLPEMKLWNMVVLEPQ